MSTLRDLSLTLGEGLAPVSPQTDDGREVTGVHVSELVDPTPYLAGGELLLTTGMPLTGRSAQARAYAARLARHGIAGLGLGLGPVHDEMPASLVHACAEVGLPLFSVSAPTPFLAVARAYWNQLAQAGQAELNASLGAHRDLVRAAAQPDPVSAVVRTLASGVRGWAARLSPDGRVMDVWPRARRATARQLRTEIGRLRAAGPHSSASFPLGEEDVVVQPLSGAGRLLGFLASASPRPTRQRDRQLVLAACALLTLKLDHRHQAVARTRVQQGCVLRLVLDGQVAAARSLSASLGLDTVPVRGRLFAVALPTSIVADDLLDLWEEGGALGPLWAIEDGSVLWALAAERAAGADLDFLRIIAQAEPEIRAVTGPGGLVESLAAQRGALMAELERCPAGQVAPAGMVRALAGAEHLLEALRTYGRADLVGTVAAYLRHRGNGERAAAALGVHRNTLRHRMSLAAKATGADLDDPDTASRLWLALRAAGLA
ncbi:PucR family transcriptional regulator ligand-binding domain-containing protein [Intrasporangium calvum]|uniref:PucR family transcriptional regulator ligand-binding domain-containing protein n=1 Tax=Intrasporangium calvum TaxID=53358 RepID=UPI000DF62E0D|nr:PucR family transcriptional regulator ligand-binding domain-containing protein [Intrasporangium calvum]AXG14537.1 PucR family transcriptional regulator [Intrasporangium calvum]